MTVYCDLDGVLAGFDEAIERVIDVSKLPRDEDNKPELGRDDWFRLKREWPTFWADLPYEPHAQELWRIIGKTASILTGIPAVWPDAATGKRIWVRRMLPKFGYNKTQEFIAGPAKEKQRYAKNTDGTSNILIDDRPKNIARWNEAGGIGILYIPTSSAAERVAATIRRYTR